MDSGVFQVCCQLSLGFTDRIFLCACKFRNCSFRSSLSHLWPFKGLCFHAQAQLGTQIFYNSTLQAPNNSCTFILLITLGMKSISLSKIILTEAYITRHNVAKNFSGGNDLLIVKYLNPKCNIPYF